MRAQAANAVVDDLFPTKITMECGGRLAVDATAYDAVEFGAPQEPICRRCGQVGRLGINVSEELFHHIDGIGAFVSGA